MKTCTKCKLLKTAESFHASSRTRDGLQRWCIECSKIASSKHYNSNKDTIIARKRELKAKAIDKFIVWKEEQECAACNERDPCCLDFHHRDPSEKEGNISDIVTNNNWSWERLMKEVDKCVILCSNCHRKVHKHKTLTLKNGDLVLTD